MLFCRQVSLFHYRLAWCCQWMWLFVCVLCYCLFFIRRLRLSFDCRLCLSFDCRQVSLFHHRLAWCCQWIWLFVCVLCYCLFFIRRLCLSFDCRLCLSFDCRLCMSFDGLFLHSMYRSWWSFASCMVLFVVRCLCLSFNCLFPYVMYLLLRLTLNHYQMLHLALDHHHHHHHH